MKTQLHSTAAMARKARALTLLLAFLAFAALPGVRAAQTDLAGPPGSGLFGVTVTLLPNGNFVVTDQGYDAPGPIPDVGAVYLYDGVTLAVISTLTGSTANDRVGIGVTVLSNGNYVVSSAYWNNGAANSAGAVTWGSATTGVTGVVSAANSLVGSTANDRVGSYDFGLIAVTPLSNGSYVVRSPDWDNGAETDAGAVTWSSGTTGVSGVVSAANSLVGSTAFDRIGSYPFAPTPVIVLNNGNYVVISREWDNGAAYDVGAVTWGSGTVGVTGVVSAANSLVGSTAGDAVGNGGVRVLSNGNYVVISSDWDNGAAYDVGAVTWGSGTTGVTGVVSAANSLVGNIVGGSFFPFVTALSNGNYVVGSGWWDGFRGAVTWGSGTTGVTGEISAANSLVGSTPGDQVGFGFDGVMALSNGNYVVRSPSWDNGAAIDAGAVTWVNGATGVTGEVSAANSLVGSTVDDRVGTVVTALNNGNYVVGSANWDNGVVTNAGAVTWCSGTTGVTGLVSAANSLVGGTVDDLVGSTQFGAGSVIALNYGNYVVRSPVWNNGAVADAGAVTWGNGTTGVTGVVSETNSLVGSRDSDNVGNTVLALNNGNYVVSSPAWNNAAVVDAGAVTWGSGTIGVTGVVSAANSLVGSRASDQIGGSGVTGLYNGNYVVRSPLWNNVAVVDAGAVTWGSGTTGVTGAISAANSLVGSTANGRVGDSFVAALNNGNYVVGSFDWNGSRGAVTWGSGTTGVTGVVSAVNSLIGSTAGDPIGSGGMTALNNGNYVVASPLWNGSRGALTWGSGTTSLTGVVSAANSLVGSTASDYVGEGIVTRLSNGYYVARSGRWDNGAVADAGAVSLGDGTMGTRGPVSAANSVLGTMSFGGNLVNFAYDLLTARLFVGYPSGNRVSLFRYTPVLAIAQVPEGIRLRFTGVPGRSYTIERAPTVTGPWSTHAIPTASLSGLIEHLDTNAPAGSAFYRTVQP